MSSVSKKLNYLIIGEKPTKRKVEIAKELKLKILDQNKFLNLFSLSKLISSNPTLSNGFSILF